MVAAAVGADSDAVSFAWELPSPEREHAAEGYVWESKPAGLAGSRT